MAQKTIVALIDDLDGGAADETATFGLDGVTYEIDLSEKNATTLRAAFAPFVASARRTGGRTTRRATTTARPTAQSGGSDETSAIREWARANGHTVSDRGRIAATVVDAYRKAH
ncbi:MAG: histone-like nucleoid-structuring protein Lsr2 [Frankia sp.]